MTDAQRLAYRVDEAAERLGIGRDTLYKLIAEGRLKTVKLDRVRLVPAFALMALLENVPTKEPTISAAVKRRKSTSIDAIRLKKLMDSKSLA